MIHDDILFNDNFVEKYIKYYEIVDNKLILHLFDDTTRTIDYSKENELKILEEMRNQYIQMDDCFYEKPSNKITTSKEVADIFYFTSMCFCAIVNKSIAAKTCFSLAALFSGMSIYLDEKGKNNYYDKDYLNYYKKLKYFIQNENIINLGITKQLEDENSNNMQEPYYLSINEAAKMHIKELKETVKLISNAYPEDVKKFQMKRSY